MTFRSSSIVNSLFSISARHPSITSPSYEEEYWLPYQPQYPQHHLLVNLEILPAIPKALQMFRRNFATKSTVSLSISRGKPSADLAKRASVYLCAAGGSPSIEPKFPWPSINGNRMKILSHSDHRVIYQAITVRMKLPHYIPNDSR